MSSQEINIPSLSPNSPLKKTKLFKDIITTPLEKVLNILYDLKLYLSKNKNKNLMNKLEWVISIITSHSLYDYQINNSQNELVEKYQKEIPEFKHFIDYLSEYNGQIKLFKKYSDLINKTALILEDKHYASFEQLGLQYPSKNFKKNKNTISILRNSIFKKVLPRNEVSRFFIKSKSEVKNCKKLFINFNNKNNQKFRKIISINYELKDFNKDFDIKIKKNKLTSNSLKNDLLNENIFIKEEKLKKKNVYRHQSTTKEIEKIILSPMKNLFPIFNYVEIEQKLTEKNFQINKILKPNFNIHELREIIGYNNTLPLIGKIIFHFFNLNEKIININKLDSFFQQISNKYNQNVLYHNAIHASDVTQNIATFIINSNFEEKAYTNLNDILSLFIASLGHDIGHPGKIYLFNFFLFLIRFKY